MSFLVSLLLPFLVSLLLVGGTAAAWWRRLKAPWAYVAFAFLLLLGLHRLLQAGAEFIKLFAAGGYFLEYQGQPDWAERIERSFTIEAAVVSFILAVVGWFLLRWLKAFMAK